MPRPNAGRQAAIWSPCRLLAPPSLLSRVQGWDKTYCLRFVDADFDDIHFFGDKTFQVRPWMHPCLQRLCSWPRPQQRRE